MKNLWMLVLALFLVPTLACSQQTFKRDTLVARYKLYIGARDVNAALDSGIVSGGGAGTGTVKGTGDTAYVPVWVRNDSLYRRTLYYIGLRLFQNDITLTDSLMWDDPNTTRTTHAFYNSTNIWSLYSATPGQIQFGFDRIYMGGGTGFLLVTENPFTLRGLLDTVFTAIPGYKRVTFYGPVLAKDTVQKTGNNGCVIADSIRGGKTVGVNTTVGKTPYLVNDTTFGTVLYGGGITQSVDTVRLGTLPLFSCLFDSSNMVTGRKYVLFKTAQQLKITKLSCVGTSTSNLTVDVRWDSDVSAGGTALNSTPFTTTSSTTGNDDTAFDNSLIPPNRWVWIILSTTTKPATLSINVEGYYP